MKKPTLTLILVVTLLFSTEAVTLFVNRAEADPFPPPKTEITIKNPQNISYSVNTIALVFSAESISFFPHLDFYYNLDGQERTPIKEITIVSEEFIPINPGIYTKTVNGSCVLDNLSEGWHSVTVYEISHVNDDPQDEEIVYSASTQFMIAVPPEPEPSPTTLAAKVSALSIGFVALGVLVYFKKRKRQ